MQTKRCTLLACALATAVLSVASAAERKPVADLTGTWHIHYQDDDGVSTSDPKLVIRQIGDKLTGTFGDHDWPIIGAIDGSTVIFSFTAFGHEGGKPITDTVFYYGAFEAGTLKGRMRNPKEAGEWLAVRQ